LEKILYPIAPDIREATESKDGIEAFPGYAVKSFVEI
jgi:hypothetical protein